MVARAQTFTIDGIDPRPVWVEVDVRAGLPAFTVVGLADAAVREARERVRAAILNSGLEFPMRRITANLAPADLRKAGPGFDLALAVAVLAASGQVPLETLERWAVFGELSLDGSLRGCAGTLAAAEGALHAGLDGLLVPRERAHEAAAIEGLAVAGAPSLAAALEVLRGGEVAPLDPGPAEIVPVVPDLCDVRGHGDAIRSLTLAAAGAHNVLLSGQPGTGKTMLARRLPGILPELERDEAIEVTRIHSVAGISDGRLARSRPFRAPHHTISAPGLVGGGAVPRPGEASLAHRGVLFLDELSEFTRPALEALRQPLEDGRVAIVRGQRTTIFPTAFMLVAATNPCPCGYGRDDERCRCSELDLARHRRRLSGPLLDRIDLLVQVPRPTADELCGPPVTDTSAEASDVAGARARQSARNGQGVANSALDSAALRTLGRINPEAWEALHAAYRKGALSARGHHRVARVARTVADLAASDCVRREHVLLALAMRRDEVPASVPA